MTDSTDSTVNPQAERPGQVQPERTPGSAPSVVPLPAGADPDAPEGSHPLPEEAIDGYPKVADLYVGEEGAPASSPVTPAEDTPDAAKRDDTKPALKAEPRPKPAAGR